MREPTVSVVIATHFRDELLRRALESAVTQTRPPLEVRVVDDTNRPETAEIVRGVAARTDVEVIYLPRDSFSSAKSYNLGVRTARGEVVALLDDDDAWEREYLEKGIARMVETGADLVITHLTRVDKEGRKSPGKRVGPIFHLDEWLLRNPGLIASNLIVRTECFRDVGYMDEHLPTSCDRDLMIRWWKAGYTYAVQDDPLVLFSVFTTGLTRGKLWRIQLSRLKFLQKYKEDATLQVRLRLYKKIAHTLLSDSYRALKARLGLRPAAGR